MINKNFKRKITRAQMMFRSFVPMWGWLLVIVELVLWMVLATAENETKEGEGDSRQRKHPPSISYFEQGRGGGWWEGGVLMEKIPPSVSRFEQGEG
jgi:hypothetical protein